MIHSTTIICLWYCSNNIVHSCIYRELHCVPDIWSLVEWSDWLTPRNLGRRYDTVFYLCCCETTPPISPDGTEVMDTQVGVATVSTQFKALAHTRGLYADLDTLC